MLSGCAAAHKTASGTFAAPATIETSVAAHRPMFQTSFASVAAEPVVRNSDLRQPGSDSGLAIDLVADEQPQQPFYRRLVSPFFSFAPDESSDSDFDFGATDESNGGPSRPGGPGDGPGGPGGGPGGPGGPGGGPGGAGGEPGFSVLWYPSVAVKGQGTELGIVRQRLNFDVPVFFQESGAVMLNVGVDESHFSGAATLPDTGQAFPSDLWNVQVGLKQMHQFSNGWTSMAMLDVGSASDKPFQSTRELTYMLGGFLNIPAKNDRDSWMLGAIYSPSGQLSFPIPLVAYKWNPTDTFHMSIGLPFGVTWEPTDKWSFELSGGINPNVLATYKFTDQWRAYGGYQYMADTYLMADRVNNDDRFYAIEQRVLLGIRWDLPEQFTVDVNAGYAFNRHYGVGDDQSSLRNEVKLESGAFLSGRLNWNF